MKKTIVGISLLSTIALAALCIVQSRELRTLREQVRLAEQARAAEVEARQAEEMKARERERTAQRLEKEVNEFTAVTASLRASGAAQASNLTVLAQQVRPTAEEGEKAGSFGKGMGGMIEKMMKDPAMREMMRGQQKAAINMMYSGIFKDMKLSPEEKEKLMAILIDKQMKTVEQSQAFFGEAKEGKALEDGSKAIQEASRQTESEIKALLGEERYAQFSEYQKDIGGRMEIDQLKTKLASENFPLQDAQAAQLLQAMKEEKTATPPVIPSDANQDLGTVRSLMTSENIDKQMKWMEDYNRRMVDRASQFLTPEQLTAYREMQEQQASMQKFGLKMASELFSGGKSGSSIPAK